MTENNLIPTNTNIVTLFTEGGLEPILKAVKKKVDDFQADVETPAGRKEIASFSHQISKTKVYIEKHGKELVSKQKAALKLIDKERKRSKDFLDEQRDRARLPLTKWEEAEERLIAEEAARIEFEADNTEALEFHALWLKEKELEALKAKIEKEEEEKRRKEEAARIKKEQIEREERLKKEAAEKAIRETQETAEKERQELLRSEREAREAVEKAERNRIAAEERAKIEKVMAVLQAKEDMKAEAIRIENERISKENEKRAKAKADLLATEKKAAHHKHKSKIENEAIASFIGMVGCTGDEAYELVKVIKNNEIQHVTLNY